ncbi:hypothetical protein PsYK624_085650 [Phanerochaete sordida]|uniref:Uncharacterized protein n=1 Tax=Phanerochaete sordida TaxID=48140 RepID=A0A9P3LED5_9APHY|nr:hypothetical protein PsYK624_085650 [Phanerochaete sordida]
MAGLVDLWIPLLASRNGLDAGAQSRTAGASPEREGAYGCPLWATDRDPDFSQTPAVTGTAASAAFPNYSSSLLLPPDPHPTPLYSPAHPAYILLDSRSISCSPTHCSAVPRMVKMLHISLYSD